MTTKSTEETKSATGSPDEGLPLAVSVTKVTDTKAREDASRMQAELERERQERAALEVRLARIEKEREEAELKAMQPDERVHRQISDLSAQVQKSQEQMRQQQLFFEGQLRAMNLVAYRERALRDLGDIPESFTSFVQGADEKSIDLAVDQVRRAWKDVQERLVQRTVPAPVESQEADMQVPQGYAAPPPNPAYPMPPQMPQAVPQGGLPTATNPVPVSEAGPAAGGFPQDLRHLTSEEAVRSGRYSGEMREQLHRMIQQMPTGFTPPNSGNIPRHLAAQVQPPVQYVPQPGGAMQPIGNPTGPAKVQGGVRTQAQEAIARTWVGQNPTIGQNVGAASALADAQAYANARGITLEAAFQQRFANSPPLTNGSGGSNN